MNRLSYLYHSRRISCTLITPHARPERLKDGWLFMPKLPTISETKREDELMIDILECIANIDRRNSKNTIFDKKQPFTDCVEVPGSFVEYRN